MDSAPTGNVVGSAAAAIGKIFSGTGQGQDETTPSQVQNGASGVAEASSGQKDVTVEQEVKPAVEHETIKKKHETEEQTRIDREKHQHHYHTTVQPLEDKEVAPTEHKKEIAATQEREINKDNAGNDIKAKHDTEQAAFKNTTEQAATKEKHSKADTVVDSETVHHHLHETIQPVIEKERIEPSVTHKKIPVHEVIQEPTQDHGVTKKQAISKDEFQHRLDGTGSVEHVKHHGDPTPSDTTAVKSVD